MNERSSPAKRAVAGGVKPRSVAVWIATSASAKVNRPGDALGGAVGGDRLLGDQSLA
jgi:hypothetical protein